MVGWPSWPQPWNRPGTVERHFRLVFSSIGSASMSARSPMRLPFEPLPFNTPTTPVRPTPRHFLSPPHPLPTPPPPPPAPPPPRSPPIPYFLFLAATMRGVPPSSN